MDKEQFIKELKTLQIELTTTQQEQLSTYYNLLITENQKINLTTITQEKDVYLKHFYDSLTITKIIDLKNINTLCDVGTGAGFPGLVLKIVFPNLKVTLIDSQTKRINFLNKVIEALSLKNIIAINSRIETYSKNNEETFDLIVSRAVSKTNILLEITSKMLKQNGFLILYKSEVEQELKDSINAQKILKMQLLEKQIFNLPIENSLRTLLKFQKIDKTPKKYPRQYNEILKNSL